MESRPDLTSPPPQLTVANSPFQLGAPPWQAQLLSDIRMVVQVAPSTHWLVGSDGSVNSSDGMMTFSWVIWSDHQPWITVKGEFSQGSVSSFRSELVEFVLSIHASLCGNCNSLHQYILPISWIAQAAWKDGSKPSLHYALITMY
jgi:hypothetical protein